VYFINRENPRGLNVNQETEKYFNNYFSLFRTDGWQTFIKELQANAASINNLQQVKDAADMNFRKGQLDVLASILNIETSMEATKAEADKEDD
jgi:hypothetical protein